jgi:hypothetical protein
MVITLESAIVLSLLLLGKRSLMALGLTNVEVSMKKMSNKNTKSAIEAELKSLLRLFLVLIAMMMIF